MDISTPTLLLDEEKCRRNLQFMQAKARRHQLRFRPHFKTHQSHAVGRWFREAGVDAIAVSSLRMAEYFAADGWRDILVAFPLNIRELDRVRSLAARTDLQLTVENLPALQALDEALDQPAGIFIKADTGYHRTGLAPGQFAVIDGLLDFIDQAAMLQFRGFLAHAGHTYGAREKAEISEIHHSSLRAFQLFRERYQSRYPDLILSMGDTPSASTMDDFPGVDELRPGNFIFYDLTQAQIGSCELEDIAVAMACPLVALHPDRNEAVLYGGAVHFSKDYLETARGKTFGKVVELTENGWRIPDFEAHIVRLSQEHGIVRGPASWLETLQIGELIGVLPVHSCLTADILKEYHTLTGEPIRMMPL